MFKVPNIINNNDHVSGLRRRESLCRVEGKVESCVLERVKMNFFHFMQLTLMRRHAPPQTDGRRDDDDDDDDDVWRLQTVIAI